MMSSILLSCTLINWNSPLIHQLTRVGMGTRCEAEIIVWTRRKVGRGRELNRVGGREGKNC